ncbi:hypothetical protein DERP_008600 [Dermatophagoides pteronyssinus]|uniref:Uncharacterized protein n=1 Tax=Dermatophagoides pteronyssinus TaxID=6956 RepID=A0ABQ8IWT6_DERPT|nr:hypothetical protein DERP_008600 [Dermatophagoides pteronyssinus]
MPPHPELASRSNADMSDCEIVSKRSSGSMSGFQSVSHIPKACSVQVPDTTKSSGSFIHPMISEAAMYDSPVLLSIPAITGSTKYGPNLRSYSILLIIEPNVFGLIRRFSRNS